MMQNRARSGMVATVALGLVVAGAAPAGANQWCGQNGLVKLSFTEGDSLTHVLTAEPDRGGLTTVDLYAVLDGVAKVSFQGEQFLTIGGFELQLKVEGAEPISQTEEFSFKHLNLGQQPGQCHVGIYPGLSLKDGRATLVHWRLLFREKPRKVAFRLDPAGLRSCKDMAGCTETGTHALYVGTPTARQAGLFFGAGYVPAYLNWEGEPDLTPVVDGGSWQQVGVVAAE